MSPRNIVRRTTAAVARVVHVLSRPVRQGRDDSGLVIEPYRGYGSRRQIFLMGRVFKQPGRPEASTKGRFSSDLLDLVRRLLRRGVRDAHVTASFGDETEEVRTDRAGYFRVRMKPDATTPHDELWHEVRLVTTEPSGAEAVGEFFVPPDGCRFVTISDIDDTVMFTGVANKLKMIWRLFVQGAESRVAFPGTAAFYRALHDGASGNEQNPILYVSRGPWTIYEVLDTFFQHHDIPVGPILFLRDWGLTARNPLPRRSKGHKKELIEDMLSLYDGLPFVLVGDSGQKDPEIYAEIVRENPGRVLAVYIRNVSKKEERQHAIEALAEEVAAAGSSLLLAADSFAMAEHAAAEGLLSESAMHAVLSERVEQKGAADLAEKRRLARETSEATEEAVEHGALDEALESPADEGAPNVLVEPRSTDGADDESTQRE